MGGKGGGGSNVMQQDWGGGDNAGTGGFTYAATGTTTPPEFEKTPATPAAKGMPVTEDPSKVGAERIDAEVQPYAPPGWGNYPKDNSNLSGLGDALVTGMQGQPGKAGPAAPNYFGQV